MRAVTAWESPAAFQLVAVYLTDKHWFRDGDDTGIWRDGARPRDSLGYSMGEALDIQLARDGVNPQTVIA